MNTPKLNSILGNPDNWLSVQINPHLCPDDEVRTIVFMAQFRFMTDWTAHTISSIDELSEALLGGWYPSVMVDADACSMVDKVENVAGLFTEAFEQIEQKIGDNVKVWLDAVKLLTQEMFKIGYLDAEYAKIALAMDYAVYASLTPDQLYSLRFLHELV